MATLAGCILTPLIWRALHSDRPQRIIADLLSQRQWHPVERYLRERMPDGQGIPNARHAPLSKRTARCTHHSLQGEGTSVSGSGVGPRTISRAGIVF
ncbi:MAG TPA: hypothetical protein VGL97_18895 [Bryobacteraceae bacterium]